MEMKSYYDWLISEQFRELGLPSFRFAETEIGDSFVLFLFFYIHLRNKRAGLVSFTKPTRIFPFASLARSSTSGKSQLFPSTLLSMLLQLNDYISQWIEYYSITIESLSSLLQQQKHIINRYNIKWHMPVTALLT